jgi:ABC-type polar amino acid transport system ATPase subunit
MGFARRVADRCAFMDQGEIIEIAPSRFFDALNSPRLQAFLSQIFH